MKYLIVLFIAQVADFGTTAWSMARGSYEANPIGAAIYNASGFPGMFAGKMVIVAIAAILIYRAPRFSLKYNNFLHVLLGFVIGLGFFAAAWNTLVAVTS